MHIVNRLRRKPQTPAPPVAAKTARASDEPMRAQRSVPELPVETLKAHLDSGDAPLLIDVREPWEFSLVSLPGARLMPMNTIPGRLHELDKNAPMVVYCHHGNRSWNVAMYLVQNGFTNVQNLTGGIDAWARRVDTAMRRY